MSKSATQKAQEAGFEEPGFQVSRGGAVSVDLRSLRASPEYRHAVEGVRRIREAMNRGKPRTADGG